MLSNFTSYYNQVRPTVLKLRNLYHIRLWEMSDWEQEGMLILYQLLLQKPSVQEDAHDLRICFKTKFTNYVNDVLRKQESQKRRFNKLAYEDLSELADVIPNRELLLDDYVAFQDSLNQAKEQLTEQERQLLEQLMAGAYFKGRKQLIRRLKDLFII